MGYKTSFWHRYHSVMVGYIMNLTIARVGEASRAGMLYKTDKVPFAKSFGTIVAERAVDVLMLGIVFFFAILLRFNDFIVLKKQLIDDNFSKQSSASNFFSWILIALIVFFIVGIIVLIINKKLRNKIKELIIHLKDGVLSIFKSKNPFPFIFYSFCIWILYVVYFGISLYALPELASKIPIGGILLAFIGGTIGIIFIQGGIGAYPIIVGAILTFYAFPDSHSIEPDPAAFALGNIIWVSQTLLMIIMGLISLFYFSKNFKVKNNEPS
ncbi:MAG: lysylphosphatidylglycerol synthase domain-containing protein, partial [Crocinitomicaceae bacterium]